MDRVKKETNVEEVLVVSPEQSKSGPPSDLICMKLNEINIIDIIDINENTHECGGVGCFSDLGKSGSHQI